MHPSATRPSNRLHMSRYPRSKKKLLDHIHIIVRTTSSITFDFILIVSSVHGLLGQLLTLSLPHTDLFVLPPALPCPALHAACTAYTQTGYTISPSCAGTAGGSSCTLTPTCASGYSGTPSPPAVSLSCSSAGAWASTSVFTGCTVACKLAAAVARVYIYRGLKGGCGIAIRSTYKSAYT